MKSIKKVLILASIFFLLFNFIIKEPAHSSTNPPIPPYLQLQISPRCIAVNPLTDQAVVTDFFNKKVSVIDLNTQSILSTVSLNKMPLGVAIDQDLHLALVSHPINNSVSVISLDSFQVVKTISVGMLPVGISVDLMSHKALISNFFSRSVSVIDLMTLARVGTISVGLGPVDVAIDSELRLALVANALGNKVTVIDLVSSQVVRTVTAGMIPVSVSINPETHVAGVVNLLSNSLTVIDLQSWETRSIGVGAFPLDVAINSLDNRALVIRDSDRKVLLVDLNTDTIVNEYAFNNKRFTGVAVDPYVNIGALVDDATGELTLISLPNPVPAITSITPDTILRGSQAAKVTIEGSGFIKASTVSSFQVNFIDNHHLELELSESLLARAGTYEIVVTNPTPNGGSSNSANLKINNPMPALTALNPSETTAGTPGLTLNVFGTGFFNDTLASINGMVRGFTFIDHTKIQTPLVAQDLDFGRYLDITAFNPPPGGGSSNALRFTVLNLIPVLTSIAPNSSIAGSPDFTLTLNGDNFVKTSIVSFNGQPVVSTYISKTQLQATIPAAAITTPGTYSVKVVNPAPGGGETTLISFAVNPSHPNVAPQPEGSFGEQYQDLIPPDATVQSYDPKRFSLITGLVKNLDGSPITDVSITILGHSGYGTARTDTQGRFSIPVEGGGTVTVSYQKEGLITTHRKVYVPWNDIAIAETIVMIPEDTKATTLTFDGNPDTVLSHQSTIVTDDRGSRSSTVVLTGDNRAYSVDASGNVIQEMTAITIRATEFTTPDSMPAKLPPNSAYTYCVELSVDGAQRVRFDKPVILWVPNFLGFNVGGSVPVGYYDRDRGVWVPSDNGRIVRLLDTNGDGIVDALDANGDGQPDDLNGNGSFSDEVIGLNDPQRYPPGSTFWKVTVTHFTPCDLNWPHGPAADAIPPNPIGVPEADQQRQEEDDCRRNASVIEERSRIFHEDIPIPGTDITLHYVSNRAKGFQQKITVPASGATVPASLKKIIVKVEVAGRTFEQNLNPLPNQKVEFIWDGSNQLGMAVSGPTTALVSIGFVYDDVYWEVYLGYLQAFGQPGSRPTNIPASEKVTLWKRSNIVLHPYNKIITNGKGTIAEGWTLSVQHTMNSTDITTLSKGDGTIIKNTVETITTVAGGGSPPDLLGDGGPATQAMLNQVFGLAVDASGNLYIADHYNFRIRKVDTNGIITTVAGNGTWGYSGDGGPATEAQISAGSVAVDASGNLYLAEGSRIRKVDTNGIITTVAGNGIWGYSGDGGPGINAQIRAYGVAVDTSGNLYISEEYGFRIRKVDTNGIITTIAGDGYSGYRGDGGRAIFAEFSLPTGIAVDSEGNVYVSDSFLNKRVRKINPSGIITTIAGGAGYPWALGDGGPATQANLDPIGLALDASGNIYIADEHDYRIRKVNNSGIITTIAGDGTEAYYEDSGDGGPATEAQLLYPEHIAVDAAGNLFIASQYGYTVRKVAPSSTAFANLMTAGDIAFSESSGQGYILTANGRHKSTIDLNTGRIIYTFNYDQNDNLVSVIDRFGNQTTIQRNASGMPIAIISPDGLTTTLTIASNNHLTRITYPDTSFYGFEYTPDGLITAKIEPEGNRFEHAFDPTGKLTDATDQEGGHWNYSRSISVNGDILTAVLTAEGNRTSYLDHTDSTGAYTSYITDPSGAGTVYTRSADGLTVNKTLPCGMTLNLKYGLDSQNLFKYVKEMRERTSSGLEKVILHENTYEDTNSDNITDLITQAVTLNDRVATLVTDTLQSTKTLTSPVGRTTTSFYDPNNLLTTKLTIPGLHDTNFGYDARGRLTSINTDIRQITLAYDARGNLSSITDPENRTATYSYDAVGRRTGIQWPDGSSVNFAYDRNGNMTVLTNPASIKHRFIYNKVDLSSSYQTPLSGSYSYLYNKDRRLLQVNFPSGRQIINIYDKDRIIQTQTPEGNINYTYLCASKLGSITRGGETISYVYDGSLVTSRSLTGTLNQTLSYAYNNDFNPTSFTYAGGSVNYTYDNDGLLTGAGVFTISRNAGNGFPEVVTGGAFNITRTFNGYGELETQNFLVNALNLTSWGLSRDKNGRITAKTETIGGTVSDYVYSYDSMGRLLTVTKDSNLVEEYQYDSVGRRSYEMNVLKGISGRTYTYSNEDHLLTAGDVTYQYDLDGFLTTKTQGSNITHYSYSSRGELMSVTLPDGRLIEYVNDPLGRRIAKKVNGVISEKYLWQGLTRLLAVYDGSDNLVMRFEYADARMPIVMTKGGVTYYLTYDQVGSLRIAADASGNVIKRIDYDSFGSIISDMNHGFTIPFGFAGGLHDRDTGLVRFGFRDYDPEVGRWAAKDSTLFAGGDVNLYGYVVNNPVNFIDPRGDSWVIEAALILAHLGLEFFIIPELESDIQQKKEQRQREEAERILARQEYEKMVEESGIREALEELESLQQRTRAIISIYENEILKQPCP